MKRTVLLLSLALILLTAGCGVKKHKVVNTVKGNMKTYCEMSDGTFEANGITYKHRLEITGRMSGASKDSTFVYLSNIDDIPFEKAWLAAGFSSNTADYFDPDDAILVEMK